MPKGKFTLIDLSSSSPIPIDGPSLSLPSSSNPKKRTRSDFLALNTVPETEELASHFYTSDGLHKHLMSLTPNTLSQMLLLTLSPHHFSPKPSIPTRTTQYAHCIYCHKAYDMRNNLSGCKVKHWGALEDVKEYVGEKKWTCCGDRVSYIDWDSDSYSDPVDEKPYCYTGKHWNTEPEDRRLWSEGWEESGRTCEDRGCWVLDKAVVTENPGKKARS